MTALSDSLDTYRQAPSEREKGTYFEELILCYLRNEVTNKDLYSDVWTYADWGAQRNPCYPLELFQRVITVSLETQKLVKSLPRLDIE